MHKSFSFLLIALILCSSLDLTIIYDTKDNLDLSFLKHNLLSRIDSSSISIEWIDYETSFEYIQVTDKQAPIVDLTSKTQTHFALSQIASSYNLPHFIFDDYFESYGKWTYSFNYNSENYSNTIVSLFQNFNWTSGVIFISESNAWLKEMINNKMPNNFNYFYAESNSKISEIINKEVYKLGSNLYFLFTKAQVSSEIVDCMLEAKLLSYGSALLLSQESSYNLAIDGSLIITQKGQEDAHSYSEHIINHIIWLLEAFSETAIYETDYPYAIRKILDIECPDHFCYSSFSLLNVRSGNRILIENPIESSITFIGNNINTIPTSQKKSIQVSLSSGTSNPGGVSGSYTIVEFSGAHLAVDLINESQDILPNFNIQKNEFDCGNLVYNSEFSFNCFNATKEKIGVFHLPPSNSAILVGMVNDFAKLNLTTPQIGSKIGSNVFTSPAKFPYFVRVSYDATYLASMAVKMLYAIGWRSCAVMYASDTFYSSWYDSFAESAEKQNFLILNRETHRMLPPNMYYATLKANYSHMFQEVIDSNARLLVIMVSPVTSIEMMNLFYDMGIRKGDFFVFWGTPGAILTVYTDKTKDLRKIIEISLPSISFEQPAYVGDVGKEMGQLLVSRYKVTKESGPCNYYDSLYLGSHALDYMINRGLDYTNNTEFMKYVRKIIFTGCSGTVKIEDQTNNRNINLAMIKNAYIDPATGNVTIVESAWFIPVGDILLKFLKPIMYAGNTAIKPSDLRILDGKCPFPDEEIRTFEKGRYLVFGICIGIGIITVVITIYIWKRWWNIRMPELKEKREISVQDFIMAAAIIIEFFQLISMGPDIAPINSFVASIGNGLSLDLEEFLKIRNGIFWIFLEVIYAAVFLWAIIASTILLRLDEKYSRVPLFRLLSWLADVLMPILGNLGFIPILSSLLNVFVCDHSIGNDFTDSYLAKDCYQFCWKSEHLVHVVLSSLSLILYAPMAIFCRPLWQELQVMAHVKYAPLHLMVKTVLQVILILMNKTIKRSQDIAHGAIFTFLIVSFVIFTITHKAYNYPRFSWWLTLSLVGVAWSSILTTFNMGVGYNSSPHWVALLFVGWAIIAITGVIVQRKKYPSLLIRKKGKDTSQLFKFAFALGHHNKIKPGL